MKKKNIILFVLTIIIIIVAIVSITLYSNKNKKEYNMSDAEKFSEEYTEVDKNNVFVYRDVDEIINILENGTGVVYLGFPECPWCQRYTKYLNEVAIELGIDKIYYYNIRADRKANDEVVELGEDQVSEDTKIRSANYLKIVSILKDYLQNNEEGNKRVYVPSVITLKKGAIVGFDDETAWDTKGSKRPDEYWTEDEILDLKNRLEIMISDTEMNICTECK